MTTTSTFPPSCAESRRIEATDAWALVTTRAAGDLSGFAGQGDLSSGGDRRYRSLVDLPWSFARQVHAAGVTTLERAGSALAAPADAIVFTGSGACLAVLGADCALVALASPDGVTGVAHAGWRGIEAGVLEKTVAVMRDAGASSVSALLGPCIHPCCYAFSPDHLEKLQRRCGDVVAGTTTTGEPALDLPASVAAALRRAGAELAGTLGECTSCDKRWFSWRARGESGRHALAVFRRPR